MKAPSLDTDKYYSPIRKETIPHLRSAKMWHSVITVSEVVEKVNNAIAMIKMCEEKVKKD